MLFEEAKRCLVQDKVAVAPDRIIARVKFEHFTDKFEFVGPELEPLDEPDAVGPGMVVFPIAVENLI